MILQRAEIEPHIHRAAAQYFEYDEAHVRVGLVSSSGRKGVGACPPIIITSFLNGRARPGADFVSAEDRDSISKEAVDYLPFIFFQNDVRASLPALEHSMVVPFVHTGSANPADQEKRIVKAFQDMVSYDFTEANWGSEDRWKFPYSVFWKLDGTTLRYDRVAYAFQDLKNGALGDIWSASEISLRYFEATAGSSSKVATERKAPIGKSAPAEVQALQTASGVEEERDALVAEIESRIVGHRRAIREIVGLIVQHKRKKMAENRPLVLMLPGPTGTGKTEICKAIAESLGGHFARFDMGEFGSEFTATNLFGSPLGYKGSDSGGPLPNAVRKTPAGKPLVVLFDEVEKAHATVWQASLAFFGEGRVSDTLGSVVAPRGTVIMMTTNRAAREIEANPADAKNILKTVGKFSDEFMGRVKRIIPMLSLNTDEQKELIKVMARSVAKEFGLKIIVTDEAADALQGSISTDSLLAGGRGIRDHVEDILGMDIAAFTEDGWEEAVLDMRDGHFILEAGDPDTYVPGHKPRTIKN